MSMLKAIHNSVPRPLLVGLVTVAILIAAVGLLVALDALDLADSAVSVLAVATSAIVAVQSLGVQRRLEREKQLGERRSKLIEAYRNVYERALEGQAPSEGEMRKFNVDLTFYGDEDAIKAWLGMRRAAAEGNPAPKVILPAQMKLVRAMRRNLGHDDKTLTDDDLFGIILKDPDDIRLLREEA